MAAGRCYRFYLCRDEVVDSENNDIKNNGLRNGSFFCRCPDFNISNVLIRGVTADLDVFFQAVSQLSYKSCLCFQRRD